MPVAKKKKVTENSGSEVREKGTNGRGVTEQEFVKIWTTSESLDEVSEKAGATKASVASRAARYRKMGVPLKEIRGGKRGKAIDVDELTELVNSLA